MLRRIGKFIGRLFLILLLLCIAVYLCIAYFYKDFFLVNTWINGVYCTGKTVTEVNTELLCDAKAPFLTIIGRNGETAEIDLAEASYSEDYTASLQNYLNSQKSILWPVYLLQEQRVELVPEQSWDEDALRKRILELDIVEKEASAEQEVAIVLTEQGFELKDSTGMAFWPELFADYVLKNLNMGMYTSDLLESNAYQEWEDTAEQALTRQIWEKLQAFLCCDIVYDMGAEQIVLDERITSSFVEVDAEGNIVLDEEGNILLCEEGIEAFVENLAEEYNTCGTQLAFEATRGETVMVPYVTYGTQIDSEAEIAYLKEAFVNKVEEVHVPTYIQQGYVRGKDDIGDTYIEVDMTDQKLYGYKNGELLVETDIVTGNMAKHYDTPEGVNFVYAKQKDRILRGRDYASPVDYWMPVKGNIGIHDASWRKKFGGEIYKTGGSHGCINVPPKVMPTIYEEFEKGTPVIMFY